MNIHLEEAVYTLAQIGALESVIDELYIEDQEDRLQNLFFALVDLTKKLSGELEALEQDQKVVDAIYAANDVRRRCTLKTEA